MDLYVYLLLVTLICLSTTFAKCPDTCTCSKDESDIEVVLKVRYCNNLKYLPLDLITSDVTDLLFTENNITVLSNIDENVTNKTQVKLLDLSDNHISEIEVYSLRIFNSIEKLHLDRNNITNIPNGLFKTLPNLKNLGLSQNPNLILPENGFDTTELVDLNIAFCNLKVIPLKFFDTMPNLKYLQLLENHISYVDSNLIPHFEKMALVNLRKNNLTMFQPEFVMLKKEHNVDVLLFENPFRCDCQFRDGQEKYKALIVITFDDGFIDDSLTELRCVLPTESKNNNGSLTPEVFLKSLDCDVSKNETESVVTNTST